MTIDRFPSRLSGLAGAGLLILMACGAPARQAPAAPPAASPPPLFDARALGFPDDAGSIEDGRNVAETYCAGCHGLGAEPPVRADAPPLRHVLSRFPPAQLAENFRSGIHVGHDDMPDFEFNPAGTDALMAYLLSIQETPPAE